MKTAKEFMQKLTSDEAFAKQVNDAIQAKKDAGAKDYTEALLPVAAELGYEVTVEQVEALRAKWSEVISEEELGKVAGGTSCTTLISPISVMSSGMLTASGLVTGIVSGTAAAANGC